MGHVQLQVDGVPGLQLAGLAHGDDEVVLADAGVHEGLGTEGSANYWLGRCDMSGGSSGGPWVQPMDEATGVGPVFSVNSWGYTTRAGMAGPNRAPPASVSREPGRNSTAAAA